MKVAVVGSRDAIIDNMGDYLPENVTEIISGGAKGIDMCARDYAVKNGIRLTEFLPDYDKYKKAAPIKRNYLIVDSADFVIAFWDGSSRGTKHVIDYCVRSNKPYKVYVV